MTYSKMMHVYTRLLFLSRVLHIKISQLDFENIAHYDMNTMVFTLDPCSSETDFHSSL